MVMPQVLMEWQLAYSLFSTSELWQVDDDGYGKSVDEAAGSHQAARAGSIFTWHDA